MPVQPTADHALREALVALAHRIDTATAGERGALVDEFAALHGLSRPTVYRRLKAVGWSSGRKRRCDAGRTHQDEAALVALAAASRQAIRKNGKSTLATTTARSVLAQNGHEYAVGNARLNTLLRRHAMSVRQQQAPTAHTGMRSLHPNHVHQVDPSLCLLYYAPDGQRVISDAEAYKNKPEAIERIGDLKCWRYVLVDHYSGAITVRYYQARGETTANLFDFLLFAWARREGRLTHGVPRVLLWDKGSANSAGAIKNALRAMDVTALEHAAGNPRAKGAVEVANNIVETQFESRLKFEPVRNVDELNAAAEAWAAAFNSDSIPHFDARMHRTGLPADGVARWGLWQTIRAEQLRTLPEPELCRHLLSRDPEPRLVRPDMTVQFAHPSSRRTRFYDLRDLPHVYPRAQVRVAPLVYGADEVIVHVTNEVTGEVSEHIVRPVAYDAAGFRADAPVIGEQFARLPDTAQDTAAKRLDRTAYPGRSDEEVTRARAKNEAPFGGLDAHSHLHTVAPPTYLTRPGTELDVPRVAVAEEKPLTHVAALRRLVAVLGRALTTAEANQVRAAYPQGVPEQALDSLAASLRGDTRDRPASGLQVVQ